MVTYKDKLVGTFNVIAFLIFTLELRNAFVSDSLVFKQRIVLNALSCVVPRVHIPWIGI